jgi:hypothetical protein
VKRDFFKFNSRLQFWRRKFNKITLVTWVTRP